MVKNEETWMRAHVQRIQGQLTNHLGLDANSSIYTNKESIQGEDTLLDSVRTTNQTNN